jgi:hypothetical protein
VFKEWTPSELGIMVSELREQIEALQAQVGALEGRAKRSAPVTISCRTNLDDFKRVEWPTVAAYPPAIGERITGKDGWTLRVVGITHCLDRQGKPYLSIELHK